MTRAQRFRYEMFVRVRDFGAAHIALFPEKSRIGQAFARVAAEVNAIEEHRKNQVLSTSEARRVKATTRAAVFNYMKTVALAARRVTQPDVKENPFRVPSRRNLELELTTARAFIEQAERRQGEFVDFGLPPTFLSDFRSLVNNLQYAVDGRLGSRALRKKAKAGTESAIARSGEVIRDLDALVAIALRDDPDTFAAWGAARRIEALGSSSRTVKNAASVAVSAGAPVVEPAEGPAIDAVSQLVVEVPAVAQLLAQSPTVAPVSRAVAEPAPTASLATAVTTEAAAPTLVPPLEQVLGRAS